MRARVWLLAILMAVVCLTASAQEDPAATMKSIQKLIAEGKGADAKTQYCTATAAPRIQKYCANAIDGDIKQFEDGERSQINQGKSLFNGGDMVKARTQFNAIKSSSLQGDRGKWLGYIDKMEKGKAAAQSNPPRVSEIASTLKSIVESPDTEIGNGPRGTATKLIDDAFQQVIGVAKAKANGSTQADLDAANAALADARRLKSNDPQIGQVQSAIAQLDAKVHPKVAPPTPAPPQPTPAPATAVAKNDAQQLKVLEEAIKTFYARDYEGADQKLSEFLNANMASPKVTPRVEGLAYFYRGAARMSARVAKNQSNPEGAAMGDFQAAKQRWLGAPPAPVQQNVSPKVLAAYNRG